jgi:spore cortex biosynthesis protein YabQ
METTAPQVYIFLITLYGGVLTGMIYDIYRGIRRVTKSGRWLTAMLDALFIIMLGLVVLAVLYFANAGQLRLYTFVGFALGFLLYMTGLSPFLIFLAKKLREKYQKGKNTKKD